MEGGGRDADVELLHKVLYLHSIVTLYLSAISQAKSSKHE